MIAALVRWWRFVRVVHRPAQPFVNHTADRHRAALRDATRRALGLSLPLSGDTQ